MRVAVVHGTTPFVRGGAELLAEGLVEALWQAGHETELIEVAAPIAPTSERLVRSMMSCRLLDLTTVAGRPIDRVVALKFPSWLVRHSAKSVWIVHQFRQAFELWRQGLEAVADGRSSRSLVARADRQVLRECRVVRAISDTVAQRAREALGVPVSTLRPPPPTTSTGTSSGRWEPFFLFPSRLTSLKRHDLALRALRQADRSVRLVVAGAEDRPGSREALVEMSRVLGVEDRVEWRGWCPPDELRDLYSRARAVLFPPRDEDYGFITAEAQLAARPVITCLDSGGPRELVQDQRNGLVVPPTPAGLAAAMNLLMADAGLARQWGEQGRRDYLALGVSWPRVVEELIA